MRRAPVSVEIREKLYEGKAKIVYATSDPGLIVQYFKDDATAFNAGSLAKRTGLDEGTPIRQPIVELYYKSDPLGDPMLNDDHVRMLKLATPAELTWIRRMALRINGVLRPHMWKRGLVLVDFKLEFGRAGGRRCLGDEISPDTCRLWDRQTGEKLDKDRFRRDLGGVEEAYQEVYRRLVGSL
ncbi:MAG: hypothetical protein DME12_09310 [Candidatus Rokuibacteriota bacterium]|nr:MAG: hypothetical protein DME12_09310 [Candidatus Rokubacteria bacterium]